MKSEPGDLIWGKEIMTKARAALSDSNILHLIETAITQPDAGEKYLLNEGDNALQLYLDIIGKVSVTVGGESGSGKSTLVDCVLRAVPNWWWNPPGKITRLTDKAVGYMEDTRILYLAEWGAVEGRNGEESTAAYETKVTISEDGLSTGVPEKDPHTGRMVTKPRKVKIDQFVFTTTKVSLPPELENRLDHIEVRDDKAQNGAVRDLQLTKATVRPWDHETYEEQEKTAQAVTFLVERDAPVGVVIPFAPALALILQVETPAVRRYGPKLLRLIKAVARLHYRQRPHVYGPRGQVAIVAMPVDLFIVLGLCQRNLAETLGAFSEKARTVAAQCEALKGAMITTRTVLDSLPKGLMSYRTVQGEFQILKEAGLLVPKMDEEGAAVKTYNRATVYEFKGSTSDFLTIDSSRILVEGASFIEAWWEQNAQDLPPREAIFTFSPVRAARYESEDDMGAGARGAPSEDAPRPAAPYSPSDGEGATRNERGTQA